MGVLNFYPNRLHNIIIVNQTCKLMQGKNNCLQSVYIIILLYTKGIYIFIEKRNLIPLF